MLLNRTTYQELRNNMIKIEKLLDGAVATITRGDTETQIFQGQLINGLDLETLKVIGGKLIYSVDETEVVEVIGVPVVTGAAPTPEIAKIVEETTVVTDTVTPVVTAPIKTTTKKK